MRALRGAGATPCKATSTRRCVEPAGKGDESIPLTPRREGCGVRPPSGARPASLRAARSVSRSRTQSCNRSSARSRSSRTRPRSASSSRGDSAASMSIDAYEDSCTRRRVVRRFPVVDRGLCSRILRPRHRRRRVYAPFEASPRSARPSPRPSSRTKERRERRWR